MKTVRRQSYFNFDGYHRHGAPGQLHRPGILRAPVSGSTGTHPFQPASSRHLTMTEAGTAWPDCSMARASRSYSAPMAALAFPPSSQG